MYIYSWRLDCSILDNDHACVLADLRDRRIKIQKQMLSWYGLLQKNKRTKKNMAQGLARSVPRPGVRYNVKSVITSFVIARVTCDIDFANALERLL
jgi:hypothetical protein